MRYLPFLFAAVALVVLMASWGRSSPVQVGQRVLLGIALIFAGALIFGLILKLAL